MSCSQSQIQLYQGATYTQTWRWGVAPLIYKSISAVVSLTPFTITVPSHGVPNGWSVAFSDVGGLASLNATDWPPSGSDFYSATVIDLNTLAFTDVDAARIGTYTSGGSIAFFTPVPLAGATAVLNIYAYPPTTAGAQTPLQSVNATLDVVNYAINGTISSTITAQLTAPQYSYALVVTDSGGNVTVLDSGSLKTLVIGVGQ